MKYSTFFLLILGPLLLLSAEVCSSAFAKSDRKYSLTTDEFELVKIYSPSEKLKIEYMRDPGEGWFNKRLLVKEPEEAPKQKRSEESSPKVFSYVPIEKEIDAETIIGRISVPRVAFGLERLPLSPASANLRKVKRAELTLPLRTSELQ